MKTFSIFYLLAISFVSSSARPGPQAPQLELFNSVIPGQGKRASRRAAPLRSALPRFNANGSRIAYGTDASKGKYPFAVHFSDYSSECSGSLIAPRVVLTAAHCVTDYGSLNDPSDMTIRFGDPASTKLKSYSVKRVIIPNYNDDTSFGDLALVQLDSAASVTPIALPSSTTTWEGVTSATAMGFGRTETGESFDRLQYTSMVYIPQPQCKAAHQEQLGEPLPNDHVCFGLDPSLKNTCSGDSGGPYIFDTTPPVQVALVSYGPYGYDCGGSEKNLDVPTSIIYWSGWISDAMSLYNLREKNTPARVNRLQQGKCFSGKVIKNVKVASVGECCDACRDVSKCKAWTWKKDTQACILQTAKGKTTSSKTCTSGYY